MATLALGGGDQNTMFIQSRSNADLCSYKKMLLQIHGTFFCKIKGHLMLLFRAMYLLLLFLPVIVVGLIPENLNDQIRVMWLDILLKTLENAGPTFIKWGQWAATRPDMFPIDVCKKLSNLYEKAPIHDFRQTKMILTEAFGFTVEDMFENISQQPIASGSIAQVHLARLKQLWSRRDKPLIVAVKVRHPDVEQIIQRDFSILKVLARFSTLLPGLKHLQLDKSVHHFGKFMTDQVDLTLESANLLRFIYNFRKWKYVSFPHPVYPFVHPSVLIETFEEGKSIAEYVGDGPRSPMHQKLADIGTRALLKMILMDNFIHGDLHPGNVFVRHKGRLPQLVFLDVGMATELNEQTRPKVLKLFEAVALRNGHIVAQCLLQLSAVQSCPDPEGFIRDVDTKFKEHLGYEGTAKNTGECMMDLFDQIRRYHVSIDGDVCTVMVATLILEGWQRKLDPNLDILEILKKMLCSARSVELLDYTMNAIIAT